MPNRLPEVEYDESEIVRRVSTTKDYVSFRGRLWKVPMAFRGERLVIRPKADDGHYGIFFGSHEVASIEINEPTTVSYVPEHLSAMSPD